MEETPRLNSKQRREARKAQASADSTVDAGQSTTESDSIMENTTTVQSAAIATAETPEQTIARLTAELNSRAPVAVAPVAPVYASFDRQPGETLEGWSARLAVASKSAQSAVAVERLQSGKLGDNIGCKLNGSILTLTIDLNTRLGRTGSDKSDSIATTGGNQPIGYEGIMAGINFFRPDRKSGKSRR